MSIFGYLELISISHIFYFVILRLPISICHQWDICFTITNKMRRYFFNGKTLFVALAGSMATDLNS